MDVVFVTSVAADTTKPTVNSSLHPAAGNASGTVSVTAGASDNVGVAGVQFLLNGANLGTEVTTPPYIVIHGTRLQLPMAIMIFDRPARDAAGVSNTMASNGSVWLT